MPFHEFMKNYSSFNAFSNRKAFASTNETTILEKRATSKCTILVIFIVTITLKLKSFLS